MQGKIQDIVIQRFVSARPASLAPPFHAASVGLDKMMNHYRHNGGYRFAWGDMLEDRAEGNDIYHDFILTMHRVGADAQRQALLSARAQGVLRYMIIPNQISVVPGLPGADFALRYKAWHSRGSRLWIARVFLDIHIHVVNDLLTAKPEIAAETETEADQPSAVTATARIARLGNNGLEHAALRCKITA